MAILLLIVTAISCKKLINGDAHANQPPETHTLIDTIIRSGANRLNSQVHIQWWGSDVDGFVKGYQYTFAKNISSSTSWAFTSKRDSIFSLSTPPGQDTADFSFWVRAIDNQGLADPTPAHLIYPVKNTAPNVSFLPGIYNPKKTFPVVRFYWKGYDLDGDDNLLRYELIFNDTTLAPAQVDASTTSAIFEAASLATSTVACKIYPNNNSSAIATQVANFKLNANNVLFVRAIDKSEAKSAWVGTDTFFVKKPKGNKLLVDANLIPSSTATQFYAQRMATQGYTNLDTLQIFEQAAGVYTQLSADNATQAKVFELFDLIVWYGNTASSSLSLTQKTTTPFFNKNGKMFMALYVNSLFDEQSSFLNFTPAQSLVSPPDTNLILATDSLLNPLVSGWPILKSTSYVGVVKPMNLFPGSVPLYSSHLSAKDIVNNPPPPYPLWAGNSIVLAERKNPGNNQPNFILSTLSLQTLDGNANIDLLWDKVLAEFGL